MNALNNLLKDDNGATLVEYGIIVALVAVAALAAITLLGSNITGLFTKVSADV
ncbi:MAG: Flp family type IVb pilin [Candidatus Eremiobacteraeota bacterium]|nr:Flp family type IVb pilin [Candidatus Eremiobacteraeota bacterium]